MRIEWPWRKSEEERDPDENRGEAGRQGNVKRAIGTAGPERSWLSAGWGRKRIVSSQEIPAEGALSGEQSGK